MLIPQPALPLDKDRTLLLLEALSRQEEWADKAGCLTQAALARVLLLELRTIATAVCG